jgi:hypothetical protein
MINILSMPQSSGSLTMHLVLLEDIKGGEKELLLDLEVDINEELIGKFDVVFNHTTLEHVFNVFKAFENICKLSKDIVIIVVPFAQEQHENEGYRDYWRFTPTCLRKLFKLQGMDVLYESANNDFNAATYLFFIASRNKNKWNNQFPEYFHITKAANWIGQVNKLSVLKSIISNKLRKIFYS